jgi:hypothetical protein
LDATNVQKAKEWLMILAQVNHVGETLVQKLLPQTIYFHPVSIHPAPSSSIA